MKNIRNIFLLQIVAGMLMVSSCSNEDYLGGHFVTDGAGVQMKVTATAPEGSNWEAGDAIGISTSYGNYDITAKNREYICEDGVNFIQRIGNPIYVKGNTSIVAYYPFTGTDGAEPVINLNTSDQVNITDYYFAKTEGVNRENGSLVDLAFKHALARLELTITVPANERIKSYRLSGFSQYAEVNPFTLDMKLSGPEDLVVTDDNIRNVSLRLIPQSVDADAAIPARLVLIGTIRSYSIDLGNISLASGETLNGTINLTDGVGSLEFTPDGGVWENSGLGGDVTSN